LSQEEEALVDVLGLGDPALLRVARILKGVDLGWRKFGLLVDGEFLAAGKVDEVLDDLELTRMDSRTVCMEWTLATDRSLILKMEWDRELLWFI
jgi:hypothetical protein